MNWHGALSALGHAADQIEDKIGSAGVGAIGDAGVGAGPATTVMDALGNGAYAPTDVIEAQGSRRIADAATHRASDAGDILAVWSLSGQLTAVDLKITEPLGTGDATIQPPELYAIDRYRAAWAGAIIAIIGAAIVVDLILVVAILAGADDAVAADRIAAGVGAGVVVDAVAIIASLDIRSQKAVTATRRHAIR